MADTSSPPGAMARLIRVAVAGPLIGMLSIVFSISFTAIIYNDALSPFLSQGIGLTLIGAALMACLGAFVFSYRGTIMQPQDITAILLSFSAANIAATNLDHAPDTVFATVAMLILIATFVTGVTCYGFGRFGLGFVARFIPYPVLAGFLAATGYLLLTGAIGMIVNRSVEFWALPELFELGTLMRWLPWVMVAAVVVALTRLMPHAMTLPVALIITSAGFYGVLKVSGITLTDARAAGLLLGPFGNGSFLSGLSPGLVFDVDWRVITAEMPTIIAVIAMTIIGALLNATALGVATGQEIDLDQDLKAVGLGNLVSSGSGGLIGFHLLGETLFARNMGLTGPLAGLAAAVGCALALVFGAGLLSLLPVGLFAAVIAYLGIDLLYTWLWVERRNLPAQDYGLVLLILAVAAAIGFLQALSVGLLAAALLFIYSYAKLDTVRLRSSIVTRRSSVERGIAAQEVLAQTGSRVHVTELTGYLFFGTANRLADQIRDDLAQNPDLGCMIIDFTRVPELDASAAFALEKIAKACTREGVDLWCSGAQAAGQKRFPAERLKGLGATLFATLDDALQAAEAALLARTPPTPEEQGFLAYLEARHPGIRLEDVFTSVTLDPGDVLVEQDADSEEMFILTSGALVAEVAGTDGTPVPVSRFLPGALLGEIAYYASVPRTARIRAAEPSVVMRLDARALEPGGPAAALAQDVHRQAAAYLARRLIRTTQMLRAGGF